MFQGGGQKLESPYSSDFQGCHSKHYKENNVILNLFDCFCRNLLISSKMSLIGQGLFVGFPKIQSCKNQIDRFRTKFGMTNFKKLCAFTLSELLLSLTIVGIIAVLSVSVLIGNVQKKLFATQVKNFVAEIEQLAQDELIAHRTRDLSNTDFGDPEKLLSDKHFSIVKSCSASTSLKDCWKTTATGKDKVIYKLINGTKVNSFTGAVKTIVLGNGALLHYDIEKRFSNRAFAYFVIDINGNDPPNISGRDAFAFYIDKKGHIKDPFEVTGQSNSTSQKLNLCTKTGGNYAHWYCPGLLLENNWKMDY